MDNATTELNFTLTVNETNLILSALSKGPYQEVAELIGKVTSQAQAQLAEAQEAMQSE